MSLKSLPLLFINLGGEMIYILDQRLTAQNIPKEKGVKVLHDIIGTMFNKRFMEELFKPQELYSRKALRTVFDRLAHASIMRLNQASMDKLYDLMTMAVKHQMSLALRAQDLLMITLNHVDQIYQLVSGSDTVKQQVKNVYKYLISTYAPMSAGEMTLCQHTVLNFLQDMHIRVSIFLKEKVQTSTGRFVLPHGGPVPHGTELPGVIRLFNADGKQVATRSFSAGGGWSGVAPSGSTNMRENHGTHLGTNMYSAHRGNVEASVQAAPKNTVPSAELESAPPNPLAKAQLDLLSRLIAPQAGSRSDFRLNLFNTDREEEQAFKVRQTVDPGSSVMHIDARRKKGRGDHLEQVFGELTVDGAGGSDDLLDLMDSAQ